MVSNHNIYKLLSLCLLKAKLLKCFVWQMISARFFGAIVPLPLEEAEFPGGEGGVPRCRTPCSPVSNPLLPGAGEMPRSKGVWSGGW